MQPSEGPVRNNPTRHNLWVYNQPSKTNPNWTAFVLEQWFSFFLIFYKNVDASQAPCKNLSALCHLVNLGCYPITNNRKALFSVNHSWLTLIRRHTVSPYGLCSTRAFLQISLSGFTSCQTRLVFVGPLVYCCISLVLDFFFQSSGTSPEFPDLFKNQH